MDAADNAKDWGVRVTLGVAVALAAGVLVLLTLIPSDRVHTYGPSMGTTLGDNHQDITVDAHAFDVRSPQVGEIVTAQAPAGVTTEQCGAPPVPGMACGQAVATYSDIRVVKRIVGGPGDRIAFASDGTVVRNGVPVAEPYVIPCEPARCALPRPLTIPAGEWFLAGDNRGDSSDSRFWGPIPTSALDGLVTSPQHPQIGLGYR